MFRDCRVAVRALCQKAWSVFLLNMFDLLDGIKFSFCFLIQVYQQITTLTSVI